MGVDLHALRFLQYASQKEPLGAVATLGRQSVFVGANIQQKIFAVPKRKSYGPYCEDMLSEQFGASSVVSFDASSYENATFVHDMNLPLVHAHQYDSVIDLGTIEHVFNAPMAFSNVASLCKMGGRIIHSLPANNCNGHGFWQVSPELFYSLYSAKNGFSETEVYIAELNDVHHWWRSSAPVGGERVEYTSPRRSYVLAMTRKVESTTRQHVQQSDYCVLWNDSGIKSLPRQKTFGVSCYLRLKKAPFFWRYADTFDHIVNTPRLSGANHHYTRVRVSELISGGN